MLFTLRGALNVSDRRTLLEVLLCTYQIPRVLVCGQRCSGRKIRGALWTYLKRVLQNAHVPLQRSRPPKIYLTQIINERVLESQILHQIVNLLFDHLFDDFQLMILWGC